VAASETATHTLDEPNQRHVPPFTGFSLELVVGREGRFSSLHLGIRS